MNVSVTDGHCKRDLYYLGLVLCENLSGATFRDSIFVPVILLTDQKLVSCRADGSSIKAINRRTCGAFCNPTPEQIPAAGAMEKAMRGLGREIV